MNRRQFLAGLGAAAAALGLRASPAATCTRFLPGFDESDFALAMIDERGHVVAASPAAITSDGALANTEPMHFCVKAPFPILRAALLDSAGNVLAVTMLEIAHQPLDGDTIRVPSITCTFTE